MYIYGIVSFEKLDESECSVLLLLLLSRENSIRYVLTLTMHFMRAPVMTRWCYWLISTMAHRWNALWILWTTYFNAITVIYYSLSVTLPILYTFLCHDFVNVFKCKMIRFKVVAMILNFNTYVHTYEMWQKSNDTCNTASDLSMLRCCYDADTCICTSFRSVRVLTPSVNYVMLNTTISEIVYHARRNHKIWDNIVPLNFVVSLENWKVWLFKS